MKHSLDFPLGFVSHKIYYFDEKWHKEMAIGFLEGLTVYLGTSKIRVPSDSLMIFYSHQIDNLSHMLRNFNIKKWLKNASTYLLLGNLPNIGTINVSIQF